MDIAQAHQEPIGDERRFQLLVDALVDYAIYWLDAKSGEDPRIYIGSTLDLPGGPTLFVADTGPGFQDAPESLVQPFMSRRPEGMGLGLHIADMVMKAHNGRLVFPTPQELNLDDSYVGAIVGLQFENISTVSEPPEP